MMDTPQRLPNPDAEDGGDWNKVWDIFPQGLMTMEETLHDTFGPDLTHLASLPSSRRKVPREVMRILAPYRPPGFDPSTCTVLEDVIQQAASDNMQAILLATKHARDE